MASISIQKIPAVHSEVLRTAAGYTYDGVKSVAKLTKSGSEAINHFIEVYKKSPSKKILSANHIASKCTDTFNYFEPVLLIHDCLVGDVDGKRPWEYFQDKTSVPKGVTWALKKTKGTTKFVKQLHTSQLINAAKMLTCLLIVKLACDLLTSTVTLVEKSVNLKTSYEETCRLKGRLQDWRVRQRKGEECLDEIARVQSQIKTEEETQKRCALKIAFAVALLVLSVFTCIAYMIQMPYLQPMLMTYGVAMNLSSVIKIAVDILVKRNQRAAAVSGTV